MMAPSLAAARTGEALLLGMLLGLLYGFLRPLRPRHTFLADSLFLLAAVMGWVYLAFGICMGDPRLGQWVAAMVGGWLWDVALGRRLGWLFRGFWRGIGWIKGLICLPFKKFFNFFAQNVKKYLHLGKNRVQ